MVAVVESYFAFGAIVATYLTYLLYALLLLNDIIIVYVLVGFQKDVIGRAIASLWSFL